MTYSYFIESVLEPPEPEVTSTDYDFDSVTVESDFQITVNYEKYSAIMEEIYSLELRIKYLIKSTPTPEEIRTIRQNFRNATADKKTALKQAKDVIRKQKKELDQLYAQHYACLKLLSQHLTECEAGYTSQSARAPRSGIKREGDRPRAPEILYDLSKYPPEDVEETLKRLITTTPGLESWNLGKEIENRMEELLCIMSAELPFYMVSTIPKIRGEEPESYSDWNFQAYRAEYIILNQVKEHLQSNSGLCQFRQDWQSQSKNVRDESSKLDDSTQQFLKKHPLLAPDMLITFIEKEMQGKTSSIAARLPAEMAAASSDCSTLESRSIELDYQHIVQMDNLLKCLRGCNGVRTDENDNSDKNDQIEKTPSGVAEQTQSSELRKQKTLAVTTARWEQLDWELPLKGCNTKVDYQAEIDRRTKLAGSVSKRHAKIRQYCDSINKYLSTHDSKGNDISGNNQITRGLNTGQPTYRSNMS
mgnify:FL=1